MAKLKTYTLGNQGFINNHVRDALGLPSHIRQARVIAVAATKAAAVQVLADHGFPNHSIRDSEFRQGMGNDIDALEAAGQIAAPGVLVTSMSFGGSLPVVRMQSGGVPVRIGRLVALDGFRYRFEVEAR
ncbi:hypothetical protein [Micromonospora carbonacea]|uniref:Uncharacterized protein n=1 Tax=Micromonospora carbonacea TaxID=47853 RepID=A0A1C5AAZ3_9ACTN|nr:hypothetical protein [Micromonospora carbonacea]SCF42380.1 hypothetical protein GA0070563_11272 [Micromonospora carbonacea]